MGARGMEGLGLTVAQAADWALLRGAVYEECRAAGCCAEWLLRLARARTLEALVAMLRSADGMVFCASGGVPSLGALRAAARLFQLQAYGVYVDGAAGGYGQWRGGGAAVFAGPARSEARCRGAGLYYILALHGAEVRVEVEAAARVQLYAGGGAVIRAEGAWGDGGVVRWDNGASRWREVTRGGSEVRG